MFFGHVLLQDITVSKSESCDSYSSRKSNNSSDESQFPLHCLDGRVVDGNNMSAWIHPALYHQLRRVVFVLESCGGYFLSTLLLL